MTYQFVLRYAQQHTEDLRLRWRMRNQVDGLVGERARDVSSAETRAISEMVRLWLQPIRPASLRVRLMRQPLGKPVTRCVSVKNSS